MFTARQFLSLIAACSALTAHAQEGLVDRAAPPVSTDAGAPTRLEAENTDAGMALIPPVLQVDSPARYPPELLSAPLAAEVELDLLLDENGEVSRAEVIAATHDAFAREALHASTQLLFSPARVNGVATPAQIRFKYAFQAPIQKPAEEVPKVALRGVVRGMGTREPVTAAIVYTRDVRGPETDAEGKFTFELPPGQYEVYVRANGYLPKSFKEDLRRTRSLDVVYWLEPERVNRFETIVRAERQRTEVARVSLDGPELKEIPGTGGDPFRVVMLLPGVSGTISGLSYPVVRGASPASTGYYLDGIRVPQLYHLFLGPAVVHPDFIEGVDFYSGGAPAQYGRLLGGVVEGRISRPHDGKFKGSAYIDLLNAGGFVEVPFNNQDTQVSLAGRFSYTGWLLGLVSKAVAPGGEKIVLDFWDYQARIEQKVASGKLRLFFFGSYDKFGVQAPPPTASALQGVQFHRMDARYRHPMWGGEGELAVTWGDDKFSFFSEGALSDDTGSRVGMQSNDLAIGQQTYSVRGKWSRSWGEKWQASVGASFDGTTASVGLTNTLTPVGGVALTQSAEFPIAAGHFTGVWAQTTWKDRGFGITLGLRTDAYHLRPSVTQGSVDPRLSVKYDVLSNLEVRGNVGLYHQPPTFLIPLPVVDLASLRWDLQEVLQTSLGFKWTLADRYEFSVDGYVNPMIRTLEISIGGNVSPGPQQPADPELGVSGRPGLAYGVEVMLRAPMKGRWFGWVSYSLQRSTRLQTFTRTGPDGQPVGEVSANLPYVFEQQHVLNAVASYRFDSGITVGAVVHFNTGRPESGEFGSQTRREAEGVDPLTGQQAKMWRTVDKDQVDRLPAYFRVDIRAAKTWTFENFFLEFYIDVLNASFQSEVLGFDYVLDNGALIKRPQAIPVIVPSLGLKGRF